MHSSNHFMGFLKCSMDLHLNAPVWRACISVHLLVLAVFTLLLTSCSSEDFLVLFVSFSFWDYWFVTDSMDTSASVFRWQQPLTWLIYRPVYSQTEDLFLKDKGIIYSFYLKDWSVDADYGQTALLYGIKVPFKFTTFNTLHQSHWHHGPSNRSSSYHKDLMSVL